MELREIVASQTGPIEIGYAGEAEATLVRFPVEGWTERFGAGAFSLLVQRATDPAAYPVVTWTHGAVVEWIVSSSDAAVPGYGRAELVYTVGDTVAKSVVYTTHCGAALDAGEDPPTPWAPWVNTVLVAAETAEEASESAQDAADAAQRAAESVRDYTYTHDGHGHVVIAATTPGEGG